MIHQDTTLKSDYHFFTRFAIQARCSKRVLDWLQSTIAIDQEIA
jgi:hypothetical protein